VNASLERPSGITLRVISDDDLSWLGDLYAETRAAELAPVPWPDEAKRAFLDDQFRRQHAYYMQTYTGADFLAIERNGETIGRLYVQRGRSEIRLMEIALFAREQGQGIGTALIRELMEEAARTSSALTLHVEPSNPAQRLYERLGFRLIEDRGVYHFLGWRAEPLS